MKILSIILFLLGLMVSQKNHQSSNLNLQSQDSLLPGFKEVKMDSLNMVNSMAYADTANFVHQKVYPCARCFLRPEVAAALEKANEAAQNKGYKIVVFDCYRPISIQYKMFEIVGNPKYVARPTKGSNHNRGAAVDVALADENGNLLDMGGAFDDFSEVSHYSYADISKQAKANRKLLRTMMIKAGFEPYENEWWHFDYKQRRYPASGVVWPCN